MPKDGTSAIIHPLHEKVVNNYRGISLLSVTCKIFFKTLQITRLYTVTNQLDSELGESAGFRKSGSCLQQQTSNQSLITKGEVDIPGYL